MTSAKKGDRAVQVSAYREEDEAAVLGLLADAFGRWPTQLDADPREFFRWKHEDSPFGRSISLVARVDGEVAGFLALMPWRLHFGDRAHDTLRGVDIAVAPRFQRAGVAPALVAESRRSHPEGTVLTWSNPNERSRPGVLRAGRRRVDGLTRYVGVGGGGLASARRLLVPGRPPALPAEADDGSLLAALADEPLLTRALSGPPPTGRISTVFDADLLRWRYGGRSRYRAVTTDGAGGGAGIAIYRTEMRGRFSVARVCEVLTERGDGRATGELLRAVRRRARADLLICAFATPREAVRHGLVHSTRTAMVAANPLRRDLMPDPTRPSTWALSLGDLEMV